VFPENTGHLRKIPKIGKGGDIIGMVNTMIIEGKASGRGQGSESMAGMASN